MSQLSASEETDLLARLHELELRLAESEGTLEAIRRGEIDALAVQDQNGEHRVYTLESADRPYRFLVEQMREGAVTLSEDGGILYCNRRLAEMLNVPPERIMGQDLRRFLTADSTGKFGQLLKDAREEGTRAELNFSCPSPAGSGSSDFPAYVSISPLRESGTLLFCGVLTDLTEQRAQLREVAEANVRLIAEIAERKKVEDALRQAQKMEAIGQLTGGIAHDFNNMLQGISSGVELMKRRIDDGRPQEAGRYVEAALQSIDRAAALTHRLLAFSRRQTLAPKRVEVNDLVGGLAGLIHQSVGPTISVELRLSADPWCVRCDPNQLESALLNLAINARDAMLPDGGSLAIETGLARLTRQDVIGWEGASPGDFVRITLKDTGTGMPPDVIAHAFEPFFTTKPAGQGTGLGLSQVYGFVTQSAGVIRLESQIGHGTSVHIFLRHDTAPAAAENAPTATSAPEPHAPEHIHLLLVDDEEDVRQFAAQALRDIGCEITEAASGPEGLTALRNTTQPLDLLIADVGLPGGLNGRQLADAARDLYPNLPILLITGYAGDALGPGSQLAPGMALLGKPFALDVLVSRVRGIMQETRR